MRRVIYSMTVSLDGFIAGPDGEINWSAPDEELHSFHNERVRELSAHFLGRRLYEVMRYWDSAEEAAGFGPVEREFAEIWQPLPKIVFSTTLDAVEGNARLATRGVAEELAALRSQAGEGDIGVGGAGLAAELIRLGLVDAYQLFVCPVVLGAGTPFFPPDLDQRIELELVESRTFGGRVQYVHYAAASQRT